VAVGFADARRTKFFVTGARIARRGEKPPVSAKISNLKSFGVSLAPRFSAVENVAGHDETASAVFSQVRLRVSPHRLCELGDLCGETQRFWKSLMGRHPVCDRGRHGLFSMSIEH
jgi:hypothetical protein